MKRHLGNSVMRMLASTAFILIFCTSMDAQTKGAKAEKVFLYFADTGDDFILDRVSTTNDDVHQKATRKRQIGVVGGLNGESETFEYFDRYYKFANGKLTCISGCNQN